MYLHARNEVSRSRLSKVRAGTGQDRQTDIQIRHLVIKKDDSIYIGPPFYNEPPIQNVFPQKSFQNVNNNIEEKYTVETVNRRTYEPTHQ